MMDAFGTIDIPGSAAGITKKCRRSKMADDDGQRIMDTKVMGVLRSGRVLGREMVARRPGRMIAIASLAFRVGLFEVAAYAASKFAVAGLTQALAVEWASNAIAPGVFRTDLNTAPSNSPRGQEVLMPPPIGRSGPCSELVAAAVFLASDAASLVPGQGVALDGGFLASGSNR